MPDDARTMPQPPSNPALTLDELIALSDEIAALVRAGVPLERGLQELGREIPGRLGQSAVRLAEETGRGRPLAEALGEASIRVSGIFRAVVEAGLRAGRLPAALESLAGSMRRLAETRRSVVLASIYPLLVLSVAWGFFAFFTAFITPQLLKTFRALEVPVAWVFEPLVWCGRGANYWGPAGPVVLFATAGLWWCLSTRALLAGSRSAQWLCGWLPWLNRSLRWSQTATFLETLALLVENRVPLDEGLLLAAGASGDPNLRRAAEDLAAAVRDGEVSTDAKARKMLPPLLIWLMAAGRNQQSLLPALRHAAESYQSRAQYQAELGRVLIPVLFTLGVSGIVTLLYTAAVFGPYAVLLRTLAGP